MTTRPTLSPLTSPDSLHALAGSSVVYRSAGGIQISRRAKTVQSTQSFEALVDTLDTQRGVLLASSYEYPGRYTRIDTGFADPPIQITAKQREIAIEALNERGQVLLPAFHVALKGLLGSELAALDFEPASGRINAKLVAPPTEIQEEERSRVPSVFTVLRAIIAMFASEDDTHLGLYGAFGYDLAFQCDPIAQHLERNDDHRDLVLYLPDRLLEIDHAQRIAVEIDYEFAFEGRRTDGLERHTDPAPYHRLPPAERRGDHKPGEYAEIVRNAKSYFARGDLFEVVPGQTFVEHCLDSPGQIFRRLRKSTPAPYGLFVNLGRHEHLVGASPEMYVRVTGRRIETCPISGTIARSGSALGDAEQIRQLLNSKKEESELTMCTDVDRNDKSRVCVPGSVRVIGRRQIEIYSKLIHTVDHVEGYLRDEFDGLDAFIAHTWAVTVTGAPKLAAMEFLENNEKSPRHWYGGAIGKLGFDGSVNTGLTLRTIRIVRGQAQVRAGATLLFDSEPQAEADETELKASALLEALNPNTQARDESHYEPQHGKNRRVLLIDHRDSFVHTLANYVRQTGAEVMTLRPPITAQAIARFKPDLVLLSPGPSRPSDFGMNETIRLALEAGCAIFGVCLGLQGLVEYFGGELATLGYPMHGKASRVRHESTPLFSGIGDSFEAGRYHSLVADASCFPDCLAATAHSEDGQIMAIEHKNLPIAALQFHPESILSAREDAGLRLIDNALATLLPR